MKNTILVKQGSRANATALLSVMLSLIFVVDAGAATYAGFHPAVESWIEEEPQHHLGATLSTLNGGSVSHQLEITQFSHPRPGAEGIIDATFVIPDSTRDNGDLLIE